MLFSRRNKWRKQSTLRQNTSSGHRNLRRLIYYDTKCHGQRFRRLSLVTKPGPGGRFLKPWCGLWKVVKALSDGTYRIEKDRGKAGERRRGWVVHFNYLKPCYTPPTVHKKSPQAAPSGEAARSEPRDVLQRTQAQAGADDTGGVKLEWLENHVVLPSEDHVKSQVQGASSDKQPAEVPYQPEVSSVNSESCQFLVRPRCERKGAIVAPELCWNSCCLPCVAFTLVGSLLVNF